MVLDIFIVLKSCLLWSKTIIFIYYWNLLSRIWCNQKKLHRYLRYLSQFRCGVFSSELITFNCVCFDFVAPVHI